MNEESVTQNIDPLHGTRFHKAENELSLEKESTDTFTALALTHLLRAKRMKLMKVKAVTRTKLS
jgi:hypothetical protein